MLHNFNKEVPCGPIAKALEGEHPHAFCEHRQSFFADNLAPEFPGCNCCLKTTVSTSQQKLQKHTNLQNTTSCAESSICHDSRLQQQCRAHDNALNKPSTAARQNHGRFAVKKVQLGQQMQRRGLSPTKHSTLHKQRKLVTDGLTSQQQFHKPSQLTGGSPTERNRLEYQRGLCSQSSCG